MKKSKILMQEGSFVVFWGRGAACEYTTGEFSTYPIEVDADNLKLAVAMAPNGTIYFVFKRILVHPDDVRGHLRDGKLMPQARQNVVETSSRHFMNCRVLDRREIRQAGSGTGLVFGRPERRFSLGCWSDEVDVLHRHKQGYRAVLCSDRVIRKANPEDIVLA